MIATYRRMTTRIQGAFDALLLDKGFQVKGLTYYRETEEGLTLAVAIQARTTSPLPNSWGTSGDRFTVELGISVPEVAKHYYHYWVPPRAESFAIPCCIIMRIGFLADQPRDTWWPICFEGNELDEVMDLVEHRGLPFLDRYGTRDLLLGEWEEHVMDKDPLYIPWRVTKAIIMAERGDLEGARKLFIEHIQVKKPPCEKAVRRAAKRVGLWRLE